MHYFTKQKTITEDQVTQKIIQTLQSKIDQIEEKLSSAKNELKDTEKSYNFNYLQFIIKDSLNQNGDDKTVVRLGIKSDQLRASIVEYEQQLSNFATIKLHVVQATPHYLNSSLRDQYHDLKDKITFGKKVIKEIELSDNNRNRYKPKIEIESSHNQNKGIFRLFFSNQKNDVENSYGNLNDVDLDLLNN